MGADDESDAGEERQLLRAVLDTIPQSVFWKDRDSRFLGANRQFLEAGGLSDVRELIGKTDHDMVWAPHADQYRADDKAVMESGVSKWNIVEPLVVGPHETRWLRTSKSPLRNQSGEVIGVFGVFEDITDEKLAAERSQHREKLEAIGRLAGGVAHDFNNLLTVMLGSIELAEMSVQGGQPVDERLSEIREAAERAADLTRQLLVFARRQIVQPRVVDPNERVRAVERLLTPLLGETVSLKVITADPIHLIRIDPGQLEQLLVNLAVNARDAMPNGGTLSIETQCADLDAAYAVRREEVEPGAYTLITVSDTGEGMDDETRQHIFEPFFTTKATGKGTGLGLATSHGIVVQNRGHISVESEPGRGTTFRIYLPRADGVATPDERPSQPRALGGSESLLVIEDERSLRSLCAEVLGGAGYTVRAAGSGAEAMEIAATEGLRLDLIVSDVVLPDELGPKVAERIAEIHPDARVLFVSGHTESTIAHQGVLDDGVEFLPKPYTPSQLLANVRRILDA